MTRSITIRKMLGASTSTALLTLALVPATMAVTAADANAAVPSVLPAPSAAAVTTAAAAAKATLSAAPIGIARTPDGGGYWIIDRTGDVAAFGNAGFYNSLPGLNVHVNNIVGITATPTGHGYWLVGSDGGIFAFGDAGFYNSLPGLNVHVNNIVGITATPTGHGYWLVGSDGGIFAFGDAGFYNSLPGLNVHVNNIVGITATPTGHGYWLVGSDGGIFAFGDAGFYGSMGGKPLSAPVVSMTGTPTGQGYWLAAADGGVFAYGDARFFGSMGGQALTGPVVSIASTPSGNGYWMTAADGGVFAFGGATFNGRPTLPNQPQPDLRGTILNRLNAELARGVKETPAGSNCNPYSAYWNRGTTAKCATGTRAEAWCADFAAYVFRQAGVDVTGTTAGAGSFKTWGGKAGHHWKNGWNSGPTPGDAVVFGNAHVGIVSAVNSPTSITMISGNWSNAVKAQTFNPQTYTDSGVHVSGYASPN